KALLASPHFTRLPTVRVWDDGGDDYERLWYAPPAAWPSEMRTEIMEFGGASLDLLGYASHYLDDLARLFSHAGRTLAPSRTFLGRFPLKAELRQNLHPGRLPDGRQVLFGHGRDATDPMVFAFFDLDGNLLEARQIDDPGCFEYIEDYAAWLEKEFG